MSAPASSGEDFRPAASLATLRRRAELLRQLRAFFESRDFWEVTTPVWSRDTVVDRHLDPVPVILADDPRQPLVGRAGFLQTSPEQHMKRLLAVGAEAIFQVTPVFRGSERGPRHNPEFTMVEWYRVGDDYKRGEDLLVQLTQALLPERGCVRRLTYREAFLQHVELDPFRATDEDLRRAALHWAKDDQLTGDRDFWLDLLLVHGVEPHLGYGQPTVVRDYPATQSALARVRRDDSGIEVAERFELYVDGIELANGYHELLDAEELGRRHTRANELRRQDGKPELPVESHLLSAMRSGLPACAGTALGFDRLVMVALRLTSIDQVLAFPVDRA